MRKDLLTEIIHVEYQEVTKFILTPHPITQKTQGGLQRGKHSTSA